MTLRWQLMAALAAAGLALLGLVYLQGRGDEARQIEKENADAAMDAVWAELGRRECNDAGGLWDFAAAQCQRPGADDR